MMISVIVPCRNEEKNIAECIHALYASKLDGTEMEVLVVDGMSTDNTAAEISKLQQLYPSLRLIPNPAQITPVAFNIGIREAKGEYIQIVGARQIISPDYLAGAKKDLDSNPDTWCVGGGVENVYQDEDSENIGLAMASSFGVGGGNFRILKQSCFVDTVGTPMYRKKVFDEIGVFNEVLIRNQDDELNYRVTSRGGKIWLNTDIKIKYYVRAKMSNLFRQYFQYGYWKVYVNKMHKTVTSVRQLIPLFFVLGLIVGLLLTLLVPYFYWLYFGGILIYCAMSLAFGLLAAGQLSKGFKVAMVFPVLHFSYGWGYIRGLIDFALLGRRPASGAAKLSR